MCLDFILETVMVNLIVYLTQLESPNGGLSTLGWPLSMFVQDYLKLIDVRKLRHRGWHHSLGGGSWIAWEWRKWAHGEWVGLYSFLLTVGVMWPALSNSCHGYFPAVIDYSLHILARISPLSPKLPLKKKNQCFATARELKVEQKLFGSVQACL